MPPPRKRLARTRLRHWSDTDTVKGMRLPAFIGWQLHTTDEASCLVMQACSTAHHSNPLRGESRFEVLQYRKACETRVLPGTRWGAGRGGRSQKPNDTRVSSGAGAGQSISGTA